MDARGLAGSGPKIMRLVLPALIVGAALNVLYPAWFSVGMPHLALAVASVLVLVTGLVCWGWSAYLLVTRIPRHELITDGPFSVAKHPLYTGVALLVIPWLGFLLDTWVGVPVGIIMYAGSRLYAPEEEEELSRTFGVAWDEYERKVMLPWL